MVSVAYRGLRHLGNQRLRETQRQVLQWTAQREFPFQNIRLEPVAVACALHYRSARRTFTAHKQGDADQTLVSGDRDFPRCTVFHDIEHRDDAGGREIHVVHMAAGLAQRPSQWHRDEFQIGQQARVIQRGQGRKKMVLLRAGSRRAFGRAPDRDWIRFFPPSLTGFISPKASILAVRTRF